MATIIRSFTFGDMNVHYMLNGLNRASVVMLPADKPCDLFTKKNGNCFYCGSLAHLHLAGYSAGIYSNSLKLSETLDELTYKEQTVEETDECVTVITTEEASAGFGIRHYLIWYRGEKGVEMKTEFYNNTNEVQTLEYLTSASLDALSPYRDNDAGKQLVFHRFKAGWSMEGLHLANTLSEIGLERAWANSGESIKIGAVGSRAVREYHPYGAIEDTAEGVTWGLYLAHNASWQMELTRTADGVSLSAGLADILTGQWSKRIEVGESFTSPSAYVTVTNGSIAESSNRLLSMRHRVLDKATVDQDMDILYNDFVTTWGRPTEKALLEMADILSRGRTKYLVMDAGWFTKILPENGEDFDPVVGIGDWNVDENAFPHGMKYYTEEIRKRGMVPGIWMEFECADKRSMAYGKDFDHLKLKRNGKVINGHVINGRVENFFDFSNPETIEYLDRKVIDFLRDNDFGYLKIDYNASTGIGIDGEDSPGENLRQHMVRVRDYFCKIRDGVPNIVIENCASGGCRLEPSMMDISAMCSASDTHEGYEGAVVAANLHYVNPPRQNQLWCTLHPEYDAAHFSHIISTGFLGRICWSGRIAELSEAQLNEMFKAEDFYVEVAPIIKKGDSRIFRTDPCSFRDPTGTQAVLRISEDGKRALVVAHALRESKHIEIDGLEGYSLVKSLYPSEATLDGDTLRIDPKTDFSGNVYLLERA